jgi:hypothetical protein
MMPTSRQRFSIVAVVTLGTLSIFVLNCLLHSSRRPWTNAGLIMLMVQGVLAAAASLVALLLVPFATRAAHAASVAAASLVLFFATALSSFIWAAMPAHLSANVMNSSAQEIAEVVFIVGDDSFPLTGLAAGEHRAFRFRVSSPEGSMEVRARTARGEQISAECPTYIDWALSHADYDVEISAASDKLNVRCVERRHGLKF